MNIMRLHTRLIKLFHKHSFVCFFISTFLFILLFIPNNTNPAQIHTSSPIQYTLSSNLSKAFLLYFNTCAVSSEIRPKSHVCVDQFGFPASLFESIEALYLFNLKSEYQKARTFISDTFRCHKLGWINVDDFWSRLVGSLIGSYRITGDSLFLNKANECSQLALRIMKPGHDLINLNQNQTKASGFSFKDSTDYPEMEALLNRKAKIELPEKISPIDYQGLGIRKISEEEIFRFDGGILRDRVEDGSVVLDFITKVLEATQIGLGYGAVQSFRDRKLKKLDLMPSSLFGEWFLSAGLIVSGLSERFKISRNSKGHVLFLE